MLKLAIWDVDGTLVDSRRTISDCMDIAFERCGLEPPGYDRTRTIVGLGLDHGIQILAPDDTGQAQLDATVTAYREAFVTYRSGPDFTEQLYDGAVETLERLANQNWLQAIATGKSRRGLEALFESHDLRRYFDTIWCADDGPGKPDPFMCTSAMDALGAEPHQSLMIGDAIHDINMGRAAGARTLGVTWGFGRAEELDAVAADEVHHDFQTLNESLKIFTPVTPPV